MDDPYARLEVPRDASPDEIKRAWRRLAREWHPDRNPAPDAPDRFKLLSAAWETLSDPARRRAFDLRSGARSVTGLPEDFLDDVASAVERAQRWIEEVVLPHHASAWRGRGAEVAARLWFDQERMAHPGGEVLPSTRRGRRRAAALCRGVVVTLDPSPWGAASVLLPHRNLLEIRLLPWALWQQGFRSSVEIDDAVLRLLLARYAQVVAHRRHLPGEDRDASLAEARATDDREVLRRAVRWVGWSLLGGLIGFMLYAGWIGW